MTSPSNAAGQLLKDSSVTDALKALLVKADGSTTFLPRRVIVGCYKRPNA